MIYNDPIPTPTKPRRLSLLERIYNRDQNHEGVYYDGKRFAIGVSWLWFNFAFGAVAEFEPGHNMVMFNPSEAKNVWCRLPGHVFVRFSLGFFSIGARLGRIHPKVIPNKIPESQAPDYNLGIEA